MFKVDISVYNATNEVCGGSKLPALAGNMWFVDSITFGGAFIMEYEREIVAGIPPTGRARNLRACLVCTIVQTSIDFRKKGCPNCEHFLQVSDRLFPGNFS